MLKVNNLSFKYGKQLILDNISFEVNPGDCVAVLGNNGVGKSTLVKCLNKIQNVASGEILLGGENINKLARTDIAKQIAYVAQTGEVSNNTVFDVVMLGRMPYIKFAPSNRDYEIVENVLKELGIEEFAMRKINQMSGGQVQKVMLARALAQQPKILILDEPTNNLDMKSQHLMLELVKDIVEKQNICAIEVLHDINHAVRYCNKFIFLKDKKIFTLCDKEGVTEDVIKQVFDMDVKIFYINGQKTVVFSGQE